MFYFLFFVYFGSLTFSFQPHLLINSSFKKEVKKNKSVIICGFLHCQAYFNMLFRVNIKYHIITTYPVHSHDIPTRNHQNGSKIRYVQGLTCGAWKSSFIIGTSASRCTRGCGWGEKSWWSHRLGPFCCLTDVKIQSLWPKKTAQDWTIGLLRPKPWMNLEKK